MIGKSLFLGEKVEFSAIDAEKDAATFTRWSMQPQFSRRFANGYFKPIPEHAMKKKLVEILKKSEEKRDAYLFAVRKRTEGDLIGFARIVEVLPTHQIANILIDFGNSADLAEYGPETMKLLLRYGFMEASLHRLGISLPAYDTEMIALYERFGFLREVQRREAVFHAGRYWDEVTYGLLKPDYKKALAEVQND
jgi:RimJ/RimL family protein N-acetyltransferase